MTTKIDAFKVAPLGVSGKTVIATSSAFEALSPYVRTPARKDLIRRYY